MPGTGDDTKTFRLGGDLEVRRLGFGAMRVTGPGIWGPPEDPAAARALLKRVIDLGVNLIDTADAYGPEISEDLLREALHPYPRDLVIATKGGLTRGGPHQWSTRGDPAYLKAACEGSLRRLGVDRIDLYQLHAVDDAVPFEDSVGALSELQQAGKIRHIGLSNVSVDQLARAERLVDVVSVQNRYNLTDRHHAPVLQACADRGIGFIPWYPLATGDLTTSSGPLRTVADRHGVTPSQVALAWLLHAESVVLPIPGTSSISHLEENVGSDAIRLDFDDMAQLDGLV